MKKIKPTRILLRGPHNKMRSWSRKLAWTWRPWSAVQSRAANRVSAIAQSVLSSLFLYTSLHSGGPKINVNFPPPDGRKCYEINC